MPPHTLGVVSVLPTIFSEDGALDDRGIQRVVDALVGAGVSGITVLGVMGEADELSEEERDRVLALVKEAADGCPIVGGVTGFSAKDVAGKARMAAAHGATAVMVSPTASLQLSEAVSAAASGGLPILVQDYPPATSVPLTLCDLIRERHPLVVGVKVEAPPTSSRIAELRRARPDLTVFGGLGGLFLGDELRAGATGVMTGFALAERLVSVVREFEADRKRSLALWEGLFPLMRLEAFAPYSLAARKEVWRLRGYISSARCRRDGTALDEIARADVRLALESIGVEVILD